LFNLLLLHWASVNGNPPDFGRFALKSGRTERLSRTVFGIDLERLVNKNPRRDRCPVHSVTSCMSRGKVQQSFGGRVHFPLGDPGA
jgi:hypothetical protein